MVEGKIVGGHLVGAMVTLDRKGQLIITNTGQIKLDFSMKKPKLTPDTVSQWDDVVEEQNNAAALAIGKAVAGVVLPGVVGKLASSALGAAGSSGAVPKLRPKVVRVEWADGNQSVIQLPDKLYTHLALVLESRKAKHAPEPSAVVMVNPPAEPDVMEQIAKLAVLRDQGVLTDDEFTRAKTELLSRL